MRAQSGATRPIAASFVVAALGVFVVGCGAQAADDTPAPVPSSIPRAAYLATGAQYEPLKSLPTFPPPIDGSDPPPESSTPLPPDPFGAAPPDESEAPDLPAVPPIKSGVPL